MNQVTTKKEGALVSNAFEADANQGSQNISQEDLALPFLKNFGTTISRGKQKRW